MKETESWLPGDAFFADRRYCVIAIYTDDESFLTSKTCGYSPIRYYVRTGSTRRIYSACSIDANREKTL